MSSRFTVFITSLLLSCIFFITCKKEYSAEGDRLPGPPPAPVGDAGYTLGGSPDECQNFIIQGTYISGARLVSSNTVEVNVTVTTIGNYKLTTDTLNGIWFSRSGTFTSTGNQKITLVGTGTPELARNLIFTLKADNSTCNFRLTVTDAEPLAVYVLESGFGNPNPCIYTLAGTYISNTPLTNSNTVSIRVYVTYPGNFTISTEMINGMMFSYTGRFTAIGIQNVLLYGTGTPARTGTYTLIPEIVGPHPLGGQACAISVTVN